MVIFWGRSICLSVYLSICPSISIYQDIYLPFYLSSYLSICLSIINTSICLPIVCLSTTYLSAYLAYLLCISIALSVYLSIYLYGCQYYYLSKDFRYQFQIRNNFLVTEIQFWTELFKRNYQFICSILLFFSYDFLNMYFSNIIRIAIILLDL